MTLIATAASITIKHGSVGQIAGEQQHKTYDPCLGDAASPFPPLQDRFCSRMPHFCADVGSRIRHTASIDDDDSNHKQHQYHQTQHAKNRGMRNVAPKKHNQNENHEELGGLRKILRRAATFQL